MSIQKYPVGKQDFPKIRNEGFVYVDKTRYAHEMAYLGGSFFLSKPRRFGKSLFISTLESFFLGKKELFEGLYIYDKWAFEEYPIIRIDYTKIGYGDSGLKESLIQELNRIFKFYGIASDQKELSLKFRELIEKLSEKYDKGVVILIDEYDKPLIDYLDKENLHKAKANRDIFKDFYAVLKPLKAHIKLLFITGVSKFSKVSIFSDLNNLTDLSLNENFNAICGITQSELELNFTQELKLYDKEKIKEWYNGYRWSLKGESVYNPYSLLNFFYDNGNFKNYWYATGTPTFLMKMCREQQFYELESLSFDINDLQNFDIENVKTIPVLFQTGYLTIIDFDPFLNNVTLGFPNREVKESYLRGLADEYIQSQTSPSKVILDHLLKALRVKDSKRLEETINLAFAQIPYDLWQKENEHFYHAIIHLLFSLLGVYIQSEVHTQNGRADSVIHFENNIYCFEFKLDQTAEEAIEQINERGYLNQYKNTDQALHKIGINFGSEKKKVEKLIWEMVN